MSRENRLSKAMRLSKEKSRSSGRAWQSRDHDKIAEEGVTGFAKQSVGDALTGQDAADMVEAPAFEAASPSLLDQPVGRLCCPGQRGADLHLHAAPAP